MGHVQGMLPGPSSGKPGTAEQKRATKQRSQRAVCLREVTAGQFVAKQEVSLVRTGQVCGQE